jgi:hypothetical protein
MKKINILLFAVLAVVFIGFIIQSTKISESIMIREPPHFLRKLGLSPPNCPFKNNTIKYISI